MEVSLDMLQDQKLPKLLCGEATSTMFYVQNKIPQWALGVKTLKEVFIGVNPNVAHLRIFHSPM